MIIWTSFGVRGIYGEVLDERAVDLQRFDRETAQRLQRRHAGAEVVDQHADADLVQLLDDRVRRSGIAPDHGLRDLERQVGRRKLIATDAVEDMCQQTWIRELTV